MAGAVAHGSVQLPVEAAPRVRWGAAQLESALRSARLDPASADIRIEVGRLSSSHAASEGFEISNSSSTWTIQGADASGALYGCLELADRIRAAHGWPALPRFDDHPAFVTRGACIGLQLTHVLPGYGEYEYPITPQNFPFFYNQAQWRDYLDFLARLRMDALYLWSGHPFPSFVQVPGYPEALEVSPEQLEANRAAFHALVNEADRRGIRVYVQFYSILLPQPLARAHHIASQLHAPTPLASDYTRRAIAAFVHEYPQVGLMVCLGEALQGLDHQIYWMNQVILPGIKEGLGNTDIATAPPVLLRTHAIGGGIRGVTRLLTEARKIYPNIDTEQKYNGESLTTSEPRGEWAAQHRAVAKIASVHVVNIHILANLEPFRYGDQRFIRDCVLAMRDRLDARGLHLYPLAFWDWPRTPDRVDPPLLPWRRDWIWFEAWARYTWNPDIPAADDRAFWLRELASRYGEAAAPAILDAYNAAGECAPRLIRRFGITEGNRQTLSLGMTLDELVHPEKYHAVSELWTDQAPPGERLQEYAECEWRHEPHHGETPPQIAREVREFSAAAVRAIDEAAPRVTGDRAEFERLRNDMRCIQAMSENYAAKAEAALAMLRYEHSHDPKDLCAAEAPLARSLEAFQRLAALAGPAYRYANSMQTSHRRIPTRGAWNGRPTDYTWDQLLPLYEKELADFRAHLATLSAAAHG